MEVEYFYQRDNQMDMMKLIVAFRHFADVPNMNTPFEVPPSTSNCLQHLSPTLAEDWAWHRLRLTSLISLPVIYTDLESCCSFRCKVFLYSMMGKSYKLVPVVLNMSTMRIPPPPLHNIEIKHIQASTPNFLQHLLGAFA